MRQYRKGVAVVVSVDDIDPPCCVLTTMFRILLVVFGGSDDGGGGGIYQTLIYPKIVTWAGSRNPYFVKKDDNGYDPSLSAWVEGYLHNDPYL